MSIHDKVNKKTGPYKLLALDGGGIRGLMTLEVLAKIEATLKEALGRDDNFVLADYFDYIAGTSTGAIIATALSLGMSVTEIQKFYRDSGKAMFDKAFLLSVTRAAIYKYGDKKLKGKLKEVFGEDTTLGSDKFKTLLLLVMRNVNTDSPWPISNNPKAKFNNPDQPDSNLNLPLWKLVRASTAAPTFFPPEKVKLGRQKFIFVDGGITPYNNPAFQLFLMATLEPYQLMWPTGEDNMLLVSVGTGLTPEINLKLKTSEMNVLYSAQKIPGALMLASQTQQDLLCRVFGKCLSGDIIDGEIGDLWKAKGPLESKLFTYMRYDAELSNKGLDKLGLADSVQLKHVQQMDSVQYMNELERIGQAIAKQVKPEHFAKFLH
ncbi:MAG: patatin [Symploca sp. SIO2G7]|nr:patatin [Symploca sp. SIO2G7]